MDFNTLVSECAPWVAPQTMAAIVKTESQFKPLAININGKAKLERQPANKEEAVLTAKWLIANNYNIDMGLGQVNSANLIKTNLSVDDAFDPCKNLTAAATILQGNYQLASKRISGEQAALHAAISAYNTGSFTKGFNNGYVQKVVANAHLGAVVVAPIPLKSSTANQRSEVQLSEARAKAPKATQAGNGVIDATGLETNSYVVKTVSPTSRIITDVTNNSSDQDVMIFR